MATVIFTKQALKGFEKLPKSIQKKCVVVIEKLKENPSLGLQLSGPFSRYYKIRLASYRIIYRREGKKIIITIVLIGPRGSVYQDLKKQT